MFFEYDVSIKSTISIIQGIDKMHSALIKMKFIQRKGGPRPPRPTPKFAPGKQSHFQVVFMGVLKCARLQKMDMKAMHSF